MSTDSQPVVVTLPEVGPADAPASTGNVRSLVSLGGFRRLLSVRLTSQFGDGLFQAALAVSVLFNPAQQTSPLKIAVGFAVLLVPFSVVGPFAGVFLDRWSRRNILYLANVIRALVALPAAVFLGLQGAGLGFFIGALLVAAINRFFLSGLAAAQPHVVPSNLLVTANAISSTLGTVAYSIGLGVTVVALHTFLHTNNGGYAWLAVAGACAYATAAVLARLSFRHDALGPDRGLTNDGSILDEVVVVARGMAGGAKHLVQRWQVGTAMAAQASCRLLYGVLTLATLLLYSRYFYHTYDAAIGGLGQVVIVGSLGVIAAAALTPAATRRFGARAWVIAMVTLAGTALLTLALPFVPALLVAATFLMNVSSQGVKIVVDTKVQTYCDENFRGRVFSIEDTLFNVCYVLGLFIGALTLPLDGHSATAIVVISAGYFVVAAAYACSTIARSRR